MKTLTSKNNPIFKHIAKLLSSATYRYNQKSAVVQGDIIINEILPLLPIKTLLTDQENSIKANETYLLSKELLKSISGLPSITGAVAEITLPSFKDLSEYKKIAILDQVSDPGNMGTLIRSALAFGIEGIHITKGSCDPFNDKVIRSSKGAVFKIPLSYEPFTPLNTEGFELLLANMDGTNSGDLSLDSNKAYALILSNETRGLDPKWTGTRVKIPMTEEMESLNVAVAGSILFYELAKDSHFRDNSYND